MILNRDNGLKGIHIGSDINHFKKICCFYAFNMLETFSRDNFRINKKVLDLGNYIVRISDSKKFLKRAKSKFDKKKCSYRYGLINYIDINDYSGKWDPFKKPINYIHQNEFRFMFESPHKNPEKLNIGDISDIAELVSLDEFLDMEITIQDKKIKKVFDNFTLKELLY